MTQVQQHTAISKMWKTSATFGPCIIKYELTKK